MTRRKLTPMLLVFRNFNSHLVVCRLAGDQEKAGAEACGERNRQPRQNQDKHASWRHNEK
jgi:hypothetical protein